MDKQIVISRHGGTDDKFCACGRRINRGQSYFCYYDDYDRLEKIECGYCRYQEKIPNALLDARGILDNGEVKEPSEVLIRRLRDAE